MLQSTRPSVLRQATPEMAPVAATLLYLTLGPLADYWMGVDAAHLAHTILLQMFGAGKNLFSYEHATFAEVDGDAAGLELSYPARMMKALEARTLLRYLVTAGPSTALRMIWRSYPLQSITEAAPDEYFLAHLGVLPHFEGRGLGRQLLERAEDRGRAAGLDKITLTVDTDNERAIRLYGRAGFSVSGTVSLERLRHRFGYRGYHHMSKDLR
jgi:ribosomal protein S18 acetylase RimI-like enzyme